MGTGSFQNWESARRVLYSEFESKVKQYSTPSLLTFLAQRSASSIEFQGFQDEWRMIAPWTISGIARQSIISSNRSRGLPLDERGFNKLCNLFNQIDVRLGNEFDVHAFMVGKAYEQLSYQLSAKEDLSRVLSVLIDTQVMHKNATTESDLDALVGASIRDVGTSTFVLYAIAKANAGIVKRAQIEDIAKAEPERLPPVESILSTLDRLTATISEARFDALEPPQFKEGLQKFGYNPLTKTPFIAICEGTVCAPQTQFILRSCSLESIYYAGVAHGPQNFGSDLGFRLEAYVGRQLREVGNYNALPEISWKDKKSVDWFVLTETATILIEVKSAHTTLDVRVGAPSGPQSLSDKLSHAYKQIQRTVDQVQIKNPQFAAIPRDKPFVGLVVTAEPTYLANGRSVRDWLPATSVPTLTLCLREFEGLVTLPQEQLAEMFLKIATDDELCLNDVHNSASTLLGKPDSREPNSLIDAAYQRHILPASF